jgi:hypothetical protein
MLVPLILLAQVLATPIQSPEDDRPVRLWLGPSPVARGAALPIYVAAGTEGYLLVLRATTDGHVEVVFPADPKSNGVIRPGAYALRGMNDRPAIMVNEPSGTGIVIAALSPRPFRYDEFLRRGAWSRDAMVASWPGADGVGTLTDIVQRMLGDGWFTYDLAIYTVGQRAPRAAPVPSSVVADATPLAPTIGVCNGCTIVYQAAPPATVIEQTIVQEVYVEPTELIPVPFFNSGRRHERRQRPQSKTEGICQRGVDCPPGTGSPAKAVLVPQRVSLVMSPIRRREVVTQETPVPVSPGLPPGVSKTVISSPAPVVVRTGSRFSTGRVFTTTEPQPRHATPAAAPAAPPQTRTIALPRAYRRH